MELMSIKKNKKNRDFIITESGIITPTFYKGSLEIPSNESITKEEIIFSEAINKILFIDDYISEIKKNKTQLLAKFNLEITANCYISD